MRNFILILITLAAVALLVALFGCASVAAGMGLLGPGAGVSSEMVAAFCPSQQAFDERVAAVKAARQPLRARVGMSACDVLATIGRPHEQTTVETADGTFAHWTYWESVPGQSAREPRLVILEEGDGRGVVSSVVW